MMRNKKLFYGILAVCVLAVVGIGLIMLIPLITPPSIPSSFNLISKYGVRAKNELNTFEGTYTKDMVMDPSITVIDSIEI